MIINKSSMERGLAHGQIYKVEISSYPFLNLPSLLILLFV